MKIWFQIGAAQSSRKMSASRIQKLLQSMNPQRYDVPTENQIKQYITTLVHYEKKKKAAVAEHVMSAAKTSGADKQQSCKNDSV